MSSEKQAHIIVLKLQFMIFLIIEVQNANRPQTHAQHHCLHHLLNETFLDVP